MGLMSFRLPNPLSAEAAKELERSCLAGGYDNMPSPTQIAVQNGVMRLQREVDESGYLVAPWEVAGAGRLMGSTATLIERPGVYPFSVELARGKVNQVRCQSSDWRAVGMAISPELDGMIRAASLQFSKAITDLPEATAHESSAQKALALAYAAAEKLVREYIVQILAARRSKQPKLDTAWGARVNLNLPPKPEPLAAAFNGLGLQMTWKTVEPTESQYRWEPIDKALDWAEGHNLKVVAGPLIDFSLRGLPDWLWLWEGDLPSVASFMCDYVETAVTRYKHRIRRWQLTSASNNASLLKLGEDDMLWLTARLAEAAWQIDPELELVIGIAQPWGEYLAREEQTYSPFIFADTLIRAGLKLAALDIEWVMGVSPRGSYCRDLLDASRLLDLYALLGSPIQVSLAYPSMYAPDKRADPNLIISGGYWKSTFAPDIQAEWAGSFAALAASKPFVRGVYWAQLTDGDEHLFPHCGLINAAGEPKPALEALRKFRDENLR